jgi:N-acetylneuraminic acid mutarotase
VSVDAGIITFSGVASLHVARSAHTATLLPNGTVLVVGGEDAQRNMLDSIELYDPVAGQWTELGHMPEGRSNHTAVLLANGKVLVAGGGQANSEGLPSGAGVTDTVLLIDASAGVDAGTLVTTTSPLTIGRSHHVAALLPSGDVLVAGGSPSAGDAGTTPLPLKEAEIYDPVAGTWSVVSSTLTVARAMASSAVVGGKVVIAGGYTSDGTTPVAVDVFDPTAQTFSSPGSLAGAGRVFGAMTALAGATSAVMAGGISFGSITSDFLDEGELYSAGAWQTSGSIGGERDALAVVALADGRAVALGGFTDLPGYAPVPIAAIYLPAENAWYPSGALSVARSSATATVLQNGKILVVGGLGAADVLVSCELSSVP